MIMPGVQKPHCSPCSRGSPPASGVSSVPLQSPSMVVTSCPLALTASTVQRLDGSPSRCTVQAPQLEVSHPQWVPVKPEGLPYEVDEQEARLDVGLRSSPFTLT